MWLVYQTTISASSSEISQLIYKEGLLVTANGGVCMTRRF